MTSHAQSAPGFRGAGGGPFEQWFNLMFDSSPTGMAIVSGVENRCVRVNEALTELYGMSAEKILDSDPFSLSLKLSHPEDLPREQELFAELVAGQRSWYRMEKRYVRPDGTVRWGLLTLGGLFEEGIEAPDGARILRFVLVQVVDITDRKALEGELASREAELQHAQKIDGIGRLAAGVAHDFNNMLTVIAGHTEFLARSLDPDANGSELPDLQRSIEAIRDATERSAGLTTQLLAYGRREPICMKTQRLSDVVADAQRMLAPTLDPGVVLELQTTATGNVHADAGQLAQIVMNLALNASDALDEGGRVTLRTRDLDVSPDRQGPTGPGRWVVLEVEDTGHGMSPQVQARMFEPFFTTRVDRPGTRGTGLGLPTVKRIVDAMGGHIQVRSAADDGTIVSIYFPRSEAVLEPLPERPTLGAASSPEECRVLVVDDEPAVRSLIGSVLLAARYWVMVARDGAEALRFVQAEGAPFDLVVTDLMMPEIGGLDLTRRLQALGLQPRMLFVTGYSDQTPGSLGVHGDVLYKPFTPAQLLTAVSRSLGDEQEPT